MKNTLGRFAVPLLLGAGLLGGLSAGAQDAPMPKVGDKAPLVVGKDQDGKTWKLEKRIGKKVVLLYFYPKDDTPGCTKQACGFRDRMEELKKQGVEVVGVSFDSPESHQKFIAKHNLNFTLLADTDGKIAEAYGVRVPGRNFARRVSFLIGLDGKIAHVTDSPQAEAHLNEMTEAVARLKTAKPTG
jgi:peroxiredoxin Q/BCP